MRWSAAQGASTSTNELQVVATYDRPAVGRDECSCNMTRCPAAQEQGKPTNVLESCGQLRTIAGQIRLRVLHAYIPREFRRDPWAGTGRSDPDSSQIQKPSSLTGKCLGDNNNKPDRQLLP